MNIWTENGEMVIKLWYDTKIWLRLLFLWISYSFFLLRTLRQWVIVVLLCVGFLLIKLSNTSLYHINTEELGHKDRIVQIILWGCESVISNYRNYVTGWFRSVCFTYVQRQHSRFFIVALWNLLRVWRLGGGKLCCLLSHYIKQYTLRS